MQDNSSAQQHVSGMQGPQAGKAWKLSGSIPLVAVQLQANLESGSTVAMFATNLGLR